NSPSNPSGAVFDQQTLNDLAQYCHENSIWLVSDEVYWSVTFEGEHTSAYKNEQYRSTTIVVNSLSKSHAMTGWRVGWAIGPDEFTEALTALSQALQFGVNQFVQTAAIVALKDTESAEKFRNIFRERRNALCDGLKKSNHLSFSIPKGGMFALVDISSTGLSGREFAEGLLAQEDIAIVPGFGFGPSMVNTVRIGFLCGEELLKTAARRIVRFTESKMREKAD
ncbi:MAG: pyridoxal phosphate-dependent aminotransferase, partial [Kordiimonadaceae bacterium]|nr:pyridoxal phosphate-dependent aminotransferase [Kordiimonadaceae bacterium]